jgi:putative colanic acid biosynthesis glycosyltransferase
LQKYYDILALDNSFESERQMKKIALINSVYGKGSTGTIVSNLCAYLNKNDYHCEVFYGYGSTHTDGHLHRLSKNLYVKFDILKTRLFGKHAFYSKLATKKLIRLLKAYDANLIHIHQVHGHYLNIPILFGYLESVSVPIIFTMHDAWTLTGHCASFAFVGCEKWKTGCHHCPQLRQYPVSLLFDRSKQCWDLKRKYFNQKDYTFITPSEYIKDCAKQSYIKNQDIRRIYNGIDLSVFKASNTEVLKENIGISDDDFVILGFAQKWFYQPNLSKALSFAKHAKNMKILMLGVTDEQRNLLCDNMIPLGFISDIHELAQIYSIADVFVNFSYEDSFGKVNAEALACGTPVVCHNLTALPEVIGDCGVTLPASATGQDFFDAVVKIKNLEQDVIFEKCVTRAKTLFDEQKTYAYTKDLYNEKIKAAPKGKTT